MRRLVAAVLVLAPIAALAQAPAPVAGRTEGTASTVLFQPASVPGARSDFRQWLLIADGGTLVYAPGHYDGLIHIGGDYGFTHATATAQHVAWPPNVVLEGATGELAWGKGKFMVSGAAANTAATFSTTGTVRGIRFQNAGDRETSRGAAGATAEAGSSLFVIDCDFEGNANGIAASPAALLVDVRDSAFSLTLGNGAADGKSHDAYVSAHRNLFTRIIVGGLGTGNDIKVRGPYGRIDQSFLVASTGRWLDAPWGGDMAVSNSVLVQAPHAESDNMFGYAEEGSDNIDPGNPASRRITYANDLIVITRTGTDILIDDGEMAFVDCEWRFVQTDDTPPTLRIVATNGRPGRVTGLPFPVDADGVMQIPERAILHDAAAIPPTPRDPHALPEVLARLLPGKLAAVP